MLQRIVDLDNVMAGLDGLLLALAIETPKDLAGVLGPRKVLTPSQGKLTPSIAVFGLNCSAQGAP